MKKGEGRGLQVSELPSKEKPKQMRWDVRSEQSVWSEKEGEILVG